MGNNVLKQFMKNQGVTKNESKRILEKKVIPTKHEGDYYLVVKGAAGGYVSSSWYESSKVTAHENAQITVENLNNVAKKLGFNCQQCLDTFYTKKKRSNEEIILKVDKAFHDLIILSKEERALKNKIHNFLLT